MHGHFTLAAAGVKFPYSFIETKNTFLPGDRFFFIGGVVLRAHIDSTGDADHRRGDHDRTGLWNDIRYVIETSRAGD